MNFKCPFCQDDRPVSYSRSYCKRCQIHFSFDVASVLAQIHFTSSITDKRYELVLDILNNETRLIYWEPYVGFSPGLEPDLPRYLATFPEVLKITPQNLNEKLHLILTFL